MTEIIVLKGLCIIMGIITGASIGVASVYKEWNKNNRNIIRDLSNELQSYKK